jgi:ActR/RegA family two-component response regulator
LTVTLRLYLDEDSMRRSLVRALRARGIDVVTALDAGMIERADREHLAYAASHARVLCTFNLRRLTIF